MYSGRPKKGYQFEVDRNFEVDLHLSVTIKPPIVLFVFLCVKHDNGKSKQKRFICFIAFAKGVD